MTLYRPRAAGSETSAAGTLQMYNHDGGCNTDAGTATSLVFDAPDTLAHLEEASGDALDGAPFGIVRMTPGGVVVHYNRAESMLSGLSPASVEGRHFFSEVAICANNYLIGMKFEEPAELDRIVDYVFTFRMRPVNVRLRLLKSAAAQHQYLLVQRTV